MCLQLCSKTQKKADELQNAVIDCLLSIFLSCLGKRIATGKQAARGV